jgi:hypothetical protein
MDLAEIQRAIETLPKDQQAALSAWLSARDEAEWDDSTNRKELGEEHNGGGIVAQVQPVRCL